MNETLTEKNTEPAFVSVIMPVRNEAEFIERSLAAVLAQTYPHRLMEVVVADGMSTDATRTIIERLAKGSEIPVYVVDNPKFVAPSGLNRALAKSRGDIIVRVDGHCEIDPDYVANCVNLLRSGKADGVGGPIETIGVGLIARAIALAMSSKFGVGGSAFRTEENHEMYTDTVAFPGYTREILDKAGSFNEEFVRNQDDEYNYRIRKMGGRILLSPSIRSRYYTRITFKSLWRQYFQYGYWKVRVLQLHPRQMSFRQFVPFFFVTSLIAAAGLASFSSYGRWAFVAITALYLMTNLAASALMVKFDLRVTPLLSLSYVILHVSYGLGSLAGLAAFGKNWISRTEAPDLRQRTE